MNFSIQEVLSTTELSLLKSDCLLDKPFSTKIGDYGRYGTFHSTTQFTVTALLRYIIITEVEKYNTSNKNKPKVNIQKPVFLDLGSGTANLPIYASHHNCESISIEFSKECFTAAKENIEKSKSYQKAPIHHYHANFFPNEFKAAIQTFSNDAKEDDFRSLLNKHEKTKSVEPEVLQKATIWYHYQVERKQNILNLFKTYAPIGALLIMNGTRDDTFTLPKDVEVVDVEHEILIFKKN